MNPKEAAQDELDDFDLEKAKILNRQTKRQTEEPTSTLLKNCISTITEYIKEQKTGDVEIDYNVRTLLYVDERGNQRYLSALDLCAIGKIVANRLRERGFEAEYSSGHWDCDCPEGAHWGAHCGHMITIKPTWRD